MRYLADVINNMKEEDVRANILDPIIGRLGYDFGSEFYVERTRHLKYPYTQIGHRSKKDVPVGESDYICGIDGRRGTFVIEAKRGSHKICQADLDQAHSYAVLPEIGAEFYVISNGHEFKVYRTLGGNASEPIVSINNSQLEDDFHQIEALLSPVNLKKHSEVSYDVGLPLADGIGSFCEVKSGHLILRSYDVRLDGDESDPQRMMMVNSGLFEKGKQELDGLLDKKEFIETGKLNRDDQGRVFAELKFSSNRPDLEYNMSIIGIDKLTFYTDQKRISQEPEKPTVFETLTHKAIPQGTLISSGFRQQLEPTGVDIRLEILIRGLGYLRDNILYGEFEGETFYHFGHPLINFPSLYLHVSGQFKLVV